MYYSHNNAIINQLVIELCQLKSDASDDAPQSPGCLSQASNEGDLWIGDPEAIQSVRRQRKSVSRQRAERAKGRAAAITDVLSAIPSSVGITRSQSLHLEQTSSKSRATRGGNGLTRRSSAKEKRSNESLRQPTIHNKFSETISSLSNVASSMSSSEASLDKTPDYNIPKELSSFVFDFASPETTL